VSRVLLTGASGFIGSNALEALLEQGHEVDAVARHAGPDRRGVAWHEQDLLAPGAAEELAAAVRAEKLLHLAWYATPGRFWTAPENERWIDASLRLLRAFGEAGGRRAVLAGTCAEYAWGDEVLSEALTPLAPATLYGACKHATHIAAAALAEQVGISLAWGRIFFLYGPREDPGRLVSGIARGLLAGEEVPTTDGSQRRDFMHVRDVAGAFVALLDSEVTGAVNIATGQAPSVRDIATLIARQARASEHLRLGALPQRPGEPPVIAGDPRRLNDEVGFRPAVALEKGIAETVAWWRSALAAPGRGSTDPDGQPA
jgi:nucleoside-diphosphate-sugar epimerase